MVTTCRNTAPPARLLISSNNLAQDQTTAPATGIPLAIGNPLQRFSIRPRILDQTIFGRADGCEGETDYACISRRGGVYDADSSSTSTSSADVDSWNGTLGRTTPENYELYNDDLTLILQDNETTIHGFPFTTDSPLSPVTRGSLGIGFNSTFLNALVDNDLAPIKSWGLWPGSRSVSEPRNGLLIVGGYDSARVGGDWVTFDSIPTCTTCLQIRDMEWITDDNNKTSIFAGTQEALQVSINPYGDLLSVPQGVYENFGRATGGVYDPDQSGFSWVRADGGAPNGTLRVTLQNGYETDIPHTEIFTRPRGYNSTTGAYVVMNQTVDTTLMQNVTSSSGVPMFGMPFLTMNYMIMDVEENQFRLAPAIRQNFASQGGGVIERKLCEGLADPTESATPPGSTSEPGGSNDNPEVTDGGSGTPVGAIVGGVVGGIAGLALLALAILFFLRRRRARANEAAVTGGSTAYDSTAQKGQYYPNGGYPNNGYYPSPGSPPPHPMGYTPVPPAEMYASPATVVPKSATASELFTPYSTTTTTHLGSGHNDASNMVHELPSNPQTGTGTGTGTGTQISSAGWGGTSPTVTSTTDHDTISNTKSPTPGR
ncbi:hypothetical protein PV10_00947 [Exophiala mesophila]|uniref:Peptidase A1 domain-containing protein n=1 Tax=Exophiala mesophila TaxID=212818 RepID=A0A0D1X5V3_EXOME|nr:uncharacterized protein PV10_00947 [Exophiala mesophila]KIV97165.1 hypothetical protein PV10_00947 [Exophiala mesophila]